jgi:hypothetical protein
MNCPYNSLPETSWWNRAVGQLGPEQIDPHLPGKLRITRQTRIGSGGSCFAQHISRALQARGYNFLVTEKAPPGMSPEDSERFGYGIFSGRYGNIYTTLQLRQLLERALTARNVADQFWTGKEGRVYDLLRPRITPNGFSSMAEARADNQQHLAAVRRLIETSDVFIFTLGLTETWISEVDGTAYPTCPGCGSAGEYDPSRYRFHNLSVMETLEHLTRSIDLMIASNPAIQIILTVSPVPLIATMEARHVLQATVYSKSVLRVAVEEAVRRYDNVHYFASYEVITGTRGAERFMASDGRTVTSEGVARVMQLFFRHVTGEDELESVAPLIAAKNDKSIEKEADPARGVICDEDDFFSRLAQQQKV